MKEEIEKTINIWDSITALGAQLSRPPYDPYREIINLEISIGREQCLNKVILSMPLIIYDNDIKIEETSLESLHIALDRLAIDNNTNLGLVSENEIKNRKFSHFKRINEKSVISRRIMIQKDLCYNTMVINPYNFSLT